MEAQYTDTLTLHILFVHVCYYRIVQCLVDTFQQNVVLIFFSPQRLGGRLFGALLEFIKGGVLAGTLYYIPATASVLCAIFCFFKSVWRAN